MSTATLNQMLTMRNLRKVSIGSGIYDIQTLDGNRVFRGSVHDIGAWVIKNLDLPSPPAPFKVKFFRWRETGDMLAVYTEGVIQGPKELYYHAMFESIGHDLVSKAWLDFYCTRVPYPEYLNFLSRLTATMGSHEVLTRFPEAEG